MDKASIIISSVVCMTFSIGQIYKHNIYLHEDTLYFLSVIGLISSISSIYFGCKLRNEVINRNETINNNNIIEGEPGLQSVRIVNNSSNRRFNEDGSINYYYFNPLNN